MKKFILLVLVLSVSLCLQMNAQVERTTVKGSKSNADNKMKGYPPHGYPCLGCAPCVPATNPVSYCDNTSAKLTPHPNAFSMGFVFFEGRMRHLNHLLDHLLARSDVAKKMKELGLTTANAKQQKVKCACGTDIYGKDEAACIRICDFLKNYK